MGRIALQKDVSDLAISLSAQGGTHLTGQGWILDGGACVQMQT